MLMDDSQPEIGRTHVAPYWPRGLIYQQWASAPEVTPPVGAVMVPTPRGQARIPEGHLLALFYRPNMIGLIAV